MVQQRIYLIWANPIFRDALRMILDHPKVEWVGCEPEIQLALEEIAVLEPDSVLLEVADDHALGELVKGLEIYEPKLNIISINMQNNRLSLYRKENRSVIHEEELLQIILEPAGMGGIDEE